MVVEALARARDVPGEEDGGFGELRGVRAAAGEGEVGVLGDLSGEGVDGGLGGGFGAEVVEYG